MPDATAQKKFSCPSCGGESQWNPAKKAIICPFCGTVSPAQAELSASGAEVIVEHDLVAALRGIPDDQRGWQAEKTSVKCQSCQAISVFDPAHVGQRCDFCGSSALVPYEEIKAAFRPESLLPMKLAENQVRDSLRHWYATRWFAPNRLKDSALTDTAKGLYIPYWTFDAQVHADWTAESGYYYYETETYRDANGRTQTRQVQKVRWVPSSGSVDHFFKDELEPASRGVHAEMLRHIEPFPTEELVPYNAGYLSGWVVERYQIDLVTAAQEARQDMDAKSSVCAPPKSPATPIAICRSRATTAARPSSTFWCPSGCSPTITPRNNFQVVINGYTGTIAGKYPKSWIKITLAVLGGLAAAALLAFLYAHAHH